MSYEHYMSYNIVFKWGHQKKIDKSQKKEGDDQ